MRKVGFIGIGVMGQPMAANLLGAGFDLVIWNRSPDRCAPLQERGATVARSVRQLFEVSEIVILMLASSKAMDEVLERGAPGASAIWCATERLSAWAPHHQATLKRLQPKSAPRVAPTSSAQCPAPANRQRRVCSLACSQAITSRCRCMDLYRETVDHGGGGLDMAGVVKALEYRTALKRVRSTNGSVTDIPSSGT